MQNQYQKKSAIFHYINNNKKQLVENQSSEQTNYDEIEFEFHQKQQSIQNLKIYQPDICKCNIQEISATNQEFQIQQKQQQDKVIECEQEQKCVQQKDTSTLNLNDIELSFELLKGENAISDILKIKISQTKSDASLHDILNILQNIEIQNVNSISDKSNQEQIEWKVNYNIIGNIGPFYNLYARKSPDQAYEFHFYIFKNAEIIKSKDLNKQQIFQNSLYQKHLSVSNLEYFHLNNIDDLKNQINKQSSNCSIDIKTNEESSHQGRDLVKLEFQNIKCNSFLEKDSFSLQSSVNQSMIPFQKSTYSSIVSSNNYKYQFKTKFIKQNNKTDDLYTEKKFIVTNL
ncbi:hypothetical protein TTHERM_00579100 (macronuclear) [Tetrahymena thermophila SB210]|uniref:Uncharacterized protein n=1 Tax=Tetrahymena thermophila (strain SB210) TaxID=312017 RepID=I7MH66_TETTS|nr:hypothetical protein TTHERM_00579100 [Tetrahymena thermophila SB210]EAS02666.2 hypothetical protein TTHERM_00579100 [Tetrahymena thermophila SB210]|eukprot:XP_001022911.2 hypothetical protein TTHERM_00579100 [Tetrahymena thermophila SB210]